MDCHTDTCNEMEAGTPARSWGYVRRSGLHDLSCEAAEGKCAGAGGCEVTHRMMRGYRVGRRGQRMEDIMYEVMTQGPALALMEVTRDLFSYKEGIYRRLEAEVLGHHAVRIVGWGEEAGVRYWRLANTWGEAWGEGGLFRIGQRSLIFDHDHNTSFCSERNESLSDRGDGHRSLAPGSQRSWGPAKKEAEKTRPSMKYSVHRVQTRLYRRRESVQCLRLLKAN